MRANQICQSSSGFVVVVASESFGVMERVGPGLAVIQVARRYPFGVAVGVFAGGPAFFDEAVVRSAGEGEVVDVGAPRGGPAPDVVGFTVVGRRRTARLCTAAISGMTV